MRTFSALSSILLLATSVHAGLEDAKYSNVLSARNFDSVVNSAEKGTLVAFFAPWCGHCKSLEPVWTKIAGAFEGDERCKVGHLDADNPENKALAAKYGVSGFPTIKFVPSGGRPAVDYNSARSEDAFLDFLNNECGTAKQPGGRLSALAGRVPSLDDVASSFFGPSADRKTLLERATALATTLKDDSSALADYYVKVMTKWVDDAEGAPAWIKSESERLGKLMSRKGAVAGRKLDEMQMKTNILNAFRYVEKSASDAAGAVANAASDAAEAVVDAAENVVGRSKQEL